VLENAAGVLLGAWIALTGVGCGAAANEPAAFGPDTPSEPPPLLYDGFESPTLAPFWRPGSDGSGRYAEGAVVLTDERARSGRRSARITLREGDVRQVTDSGKENERAELDSGKHPLLGQDVWCGFSFLVPEGFPIVDVRLVLNQWKQSGLAGSPIVAQRYREGRSTITVRDLRTRGEWRAVVELEPIHPDRWNDMVFHVRFATDASGLIEVWRNRHSVARISGPTASVEGKPYFYHKLGLYRDRMAEPMTVYVDDYTLGGSFEAVDPARFDG
jgi:hypothetical protein